MGAIPGANSTVALKLGSTFGTASSVGAGDKWPVRVSRNENVTPLERTLIGSGDIMKANAARGKTSPTVSVEGELGYNDPSIAAIRQFFGATSVVAGATVGIHSIFVNETANNRYATLAMTPLTGSIIEYPSAAATSLTLSFADPADYMRLAMDFLANSELTSGTTNSAAAVDATTMADTTPVVVQTTDEFLINAQSGVALATSTHRLNVQSVSFSYQRPQEHVFEARGSAGNGAPVVSGDTPFLCTVQVTLKELDDQAFFLWQQLASSTAGFYKASFTVTDTSTPISGSAYRQLVLNFPALKLTGSVDWSLQSASRNPVTITFDAFVADTNPSGMIDRYPYVIVRNGKLTAY